MFNSRNRLFSAALVMALSLGALTACGDPPATVVAPAPAPTVISAAPAAAASPVIVNAAPAAAHSGMSDMLVGGALGYAMANAGNARGTAPPSQHTTVNKTVVHKTVVVNKHAARPSSSVNLSKSVATRTTSSSRSSWGGTSSGRR